jgi:hypothetical protein
MPQSNRLPFEVYHHAIIGTTGSGKSYFAWRDSARTGFTVWWNTDDDDPPPGVKPLTADMDVSPRQLVEAAKHPGAVIAYVPDDRLLVARAELDALIDYMMHPKRSVGVRLVVDEAHVYAPNGQQVGPLQEAARRFRKRDVACTFITQRPSAISKDLIGLCAVKTIFRTDEWAWLKHHELPAAEIMARFATTDHPHAFIQVLPGGVVKGPFIIGERGITNA